MNSTNLGNQLYEIVSLARGAMFDQGELAQLTYGAFDIASRSMQSTEKDEIEVTFPIGYKPDKTTMEGTRTYCKDKLLEKYQFLAIHQLSVNALVQLVTIVETMLGDIVRSVIMRYPHKLGGKRTLPIQAVLESTSIEEVHLRATDAFLNELAYKSPAEFSDSMQQLLSVNLLECPAFHRYMEIKATRDIFIHNRGVANDIYVRKAGSHVRVKSGMNLPANIQYFLESYEYCLQIADWLEEELHSHWHSSEYENHMQSKIKLPIEAPASSDATGETL